MICGFVAKGRATDGAVKARPLSAKELAAIQTRVDGLPLAGRAGPLQIDRTQAFAVGGPGFQEFLLVPVRYESADSVPGYTTPRCGVFLLRGNDKSEFVRTIGYEWTGALRCNSLSGVGFVAGKTVAPPRILLLYSSSSPNASVQEPVVLDWSESDSRYFDNEQISRRMEDDDKVTSIPTMKRRLGSY